MHPSYFLNFLWIVILIWTFFLLIPYPNCKNPVSRTALENPLSPETLLPNNLKRPWNPLKQHWDSLNCPFNLMKSLKPLETGLKLPKYSWNLMKRSWNFIKPSETVLKTSKTHKNPLISHKNHFKKPLSSKTPLKLLETS